MIIFRQITLAYIYVEDGLEKGETGSKEDLEGDFDSLGKDKGQV